MAIYKIKGKVQHYAWGGTNYIPSLLHIENSANKNFAEYWLGTHTLAPAVTESTNQPIDQLIQPHKLSYLLKILDVKDMLSIQVHPSKKSAEEMFAEENKAGIPLNAPNRNYKDDNHKPELVVALGEFWLLHGFKSKDDLNKTLQFVPELNFLIETFKNRGYQDIYREVMLMPQEEVNIKLQPLIDRIIPLYERNQLKKNTADFWAARAAKTYNTPGRIDRGIFSIYFFNLVELKKGQGVFQDAGVPHAYLEGQNVEIMSNSDNVLRGGLTVKHIDVNELMKHIKFETVDTVILEPRERNGEEMVYDTPVDDFKLSCFRVKKGEKSGFSTDSTDIILQIEGKITLQESDAEINLSSGESALILPGTDIQMRSEQDSLVFRATSGKK
ncbi:MAG TPA: mannose-6-phosphate isomerase, class I [Chitinophagaceae bacterium]|nr:mannose-6-phosphate isomerase, class I [Chitinophagaceae bacterium]